MATLAQFVENPESLTSYKSWLSQPMTQEMLELAKSLAEPAPLPEKQRTGEQALYHAGYFAGAYAIYKMLANLDEFVEQQLTMARAEGLLKETDYGWSEVRKAQHE